MARLKQSPFKKHGPVSNHLPVEYYELLKLVLPLLGWKFHGNGIECGWTKGQYEYWVHDDGRIVFTSKP